MEPLALQRTPTDTVFVRSVHVLAALCLILFCAAYHIFCIEQQVHGALPGHRPVSLFGGFFGVMAASLGLACLEPLMIRGGRAGFITRSALLPVLLFPSVFSWLVPALLEGGEKGPFINFFLPFLWGGMLAVVLRTFFRNAKLSGRSFFLFTALGIGHACFALLIPLIDEAKTSSVLVEQRWLPMLNFTSAALCAVAAYIAWYLQPWPQTRSRSSLRELQREAFSFDGFLRPPLLVTLIVLSSCRTLSGFWNYLYYARYCVHDGRSEYTHWLLAMLLVCVGVFLSGKNGKQTLRLLPPVAALCVGLSPVLNLLPQGAVAHQFVYGLGLFGNEAVLLSAFLICLHCTENGGRQVMLQLCPLYLAVGIAMLGWLLSRFSQLAAPELALPVTWGLGVTCVMSAFFAWRIFFTRARLAEEPQITTIWAEESPMANLGNESERERQEATFARMQAFAKVHKLSGRERDVMELLMRGCSTEKMATSLALRESSVRTYVNSLLRKTGTGSRLNLVAALAFGEETQTRENSARQESAAEGKKMVTMSK